MHLAPASHEEDEIICRFTAVSLDDSPCYEAFSYVWGESSGSCFVTVDDNPVGVTDNIHSCLRHLRLFDQERIIWVDALCINQSNLQEKMHQVSHMGNIYKQASQIVVWLGDSWEGIDVAIEFFRQTAEDMAIHFDPLSRP